MLTLITISRLENAWRIGGAIAFAGVLLLLTGCYRPPQIGCEAPQYASRDGLLRPLHDNSDGIAISPDGKFAVLVPDEQPSNELFIVDLDSQTAVRVRHPDRRMTVETPTFSPDGKRIAIAASESGTRGLSKIWIISREGEGLSQLDSPVRSYRLPSFSPNGDRLVYWRDVAPPILPTRKRRLEDRELLPWSIFEYDFRTGLEQRISERVYGIPCGVFYDTRQDGFYYCAIDLYKITPAANGQWSWGSIDNWLQYEEELNGARMFYLRRGEPVEGKPKPLLPKRDLYSNMARITAVLKNGDVLLEQTISDPTSKLTTSSAAVWFRDGAFEVALHVTGTGVRDPVASRDGAVILAKVVSRPDPKVCQWLTEYVVAEHGKIQKRFGFGDIKVTKSTELMVPVSRNP